MKNRIAWMLLSLILGQERASRVVAFFDALFHCRSYYGETMEYRAQFFSKLCHHCMGPHPADAKFCPGCGKKILSEDEKAALEQEETEAAWEEYYRQRRGEDEEQRETERCPCGHKRSDHYLEDGYCEAPSCGCPGFGISVEEWEEPPTQVFYTEAPGGHYGWE